MRSSMKYGMILFTVIAFLLIVGLETALAQQTSTFEGSVAGITTGVFARGIITVKGDKGEVLNFAVGRKTIYVPKRYPGVGQTHDRESLAGVLNLHPNGGSYGQNLARLRTMGLLPERGTIKLTEAAFA